MRGSRKRKLDVYYAIGTVDSDQRSLHHLLEFVVYGSVANRADSSWLAYPTKTHWKLNDVQS